jgi:hypothetical protein
MYEVRSSAGSGRNLLGMRGEHKGGKESLSRIPLSRSTPSGDTELAESKASDQTIMGIAGHVSKKMLQHYSHVRMEAKRSALDALAMAATQTSDLSLNRDSYDTKDDTKSQAESEGMLQVADSMVELVGIEPTTSSLRTMRSPS